MTALPHITAQVAPFVSVLGEDLAAELFLNFGGTVIEFHPNPRESSQHVKLVGLENARALTNATLFSAKRIPTARRFVAVVLRKNGKSIVEIARTLHCADESVRRWLRDTPKSPETAPNQLRLF